MTTENSKPIVLDRFKLKENLKENFVAYLDVLGFSELVNSKNSAADLDSYFSKITDELEDIRQTDPSNKIQSLLISDSIILIAPKGLDGLKLLINTVRRIQSALVWRKIILRGGISFGEVFYDETHNIIVGKGYIKAYKLETLATYPRVIIDPAIIKLVAEDKVAFLKAVNGTLEYNDKRKVYVPSEFSKIQEDGIFVDYSNKTIRNNDINNNIKSVYEVIKNNLYTHQGLFQKYIWLRDYFLECMKLTESLATNQKHKKDINVWIEKFERL
ncbi:hypothetical protein [Ferruginibacter albus]|uniref:hypothetical protein n=1 Tax=Ferruginibacter albus TaxID=2875540 RepID=UPI001CC3E889|nr:hypothetical protein [Ferruginibacter albus]UAY53202.1 hypothetical protein K9M53_05905 [Ferruginibacter albus]